MYRGILWFLYSKMICLKKIRVVAKWPERCRWLSLAKSVVGRSRKEDRVMVFTLSTSPSFSSTSQIFRDKKRNWGVPCWPGSEHSRLSLPWPGFNPGQRTEVQQSHRAPHPSSGSTFHLAKSKLSCLALKYLLNPVKVLPAPPWTLPSSPKHWVSQHPSVLLPCLQAESYTLAFYLQGYILFSST